MKIVSIDMKSNFGFFKNPQFNGEKENRHYTFDSIHRVAILGMLGSLIGLSGMKNKTRKYPEFFEKLNNLKIGIQIRNSVNKAWFSMNSSTGHHSNGTKKKGLNLILNQQFIIHPEYRIYIGYDSKNLYHCQIIKILEKNYEGYFGDIYFGKSPFIIDRSNYQEYDDYQEVNNFSGKIETIFHSDYEIQTDRKNKNKNNKYELKYIFEKSKENISEFSISLPFILEEIYEKNAKKAGYKKILNFNSTSKKIKIEKVNTIEKIIKIDNNTAISIM